MPSKQRSKPTLTRKALWFISTVLLLLCSSCKTSIKNEIFCTPIPGGLGATCDDLFTQDQQILSQAQWVALKQSWIASGQTVEVTTSGAVGDLKGEIEILCSHTPCEEENGASITPNPSPTPEGSN